jgi:hypothetical protein
MDGEVLEIYIYEDGGLILYPALSLIREFLEEIGGSEFDFIPYCG